METIEERGRPQVPPGTSQERRNEVSRSPLGQLFRINAVLLVANASTGLVNFLYHALVGHLLGPAGYGTVASLVNLSYITVLAPATIVLTVFTRAAAALSSTGRLGQLRRMWNAFTLWLLVAGAAATLIFALGLSGPVALFLKVPRAQGAVAVLGLLYLAGFVSPINQGMLQGTQRFAWLATMIASGPLLRVALAAVFVALGGGVEGAILAFVLSTLLPYLLSFWPLRRFLRSVTSEAVTLKPWLGYSTAVAVSTACTMLLYKVDTILAKHFLPTVEAGRYASLATAGKIVYFIGGSVVIVMFPKVAAAQARREPHAHLLAFSLLAVLALSLSVVAMFAAFPAVVLTHMFGPSYVAVQGSLAWYGMAMLLFALCGVFTQYFLSLDDRRFLWMMVACSLGQIGALWIWHSDVSHMVRVMVGSMVVLLAGLSALYVAPTGRRPQRYPGGQGP